MFETKDTQLKESLGVVLQYQINVVEALVSDIVANGIVGNRDNLAIARRVYGSISFCARSAGVDTANYDLTCSRLLEKIPMETIK